MKSEEKRALLKIFSEEDIAATTPPVSEIFYRLIEFLHDEMTYPLPTIEKGFKEAFNEINKY